MVAQAPDTPPAGRVPTSVLVTKRPEGHTSMSKPASAARAAESKNTVDAGLGQKPYLCRSADNEATPGTPRSKSGTA